MYFITRPWFCQHLFAIIFILFDRTRFLRVCTAFFTVFFRVHRRAFCPPPAQQGSVPVFLFCSSYVFLLYGHPAADLLHPQGLRTFSGKKPFKAQNQHFL